MKIKVWALDGTFFVLLAAVALSARCDANHVLGVADGGQPAASAGTTGAAGIGGATGAGGTAGGAVNLTEGGAKADAATLGASQSWTGYVENHMFGSGSDAIVLNFATDAKGVVKGTIVFGAGTPPPPPTDPNVGYPPALLNVIYPQVVGDGWASYLAEGYSYAFDGGSLAANRLRLTFDQWQLWAGWCALETPAPDGSGRCAPEWEGTFGADGGTLACSLINPGTDAMVPVDCSKYMLCGVGGNTGEGVCACTKSACSVRTAGANSSTFDIFLTGDTASGSAKLPPFGAANVHFVKN